MDRREMLRAVGSVGLGFTIHDGVASAAERDRHADGAAAASPISGAHAHFCGIHVAKKNRNFQLIAQHYCTAHNGHDHSLGLFQCLLYDSPASNAKLLGVEYIISNDQFRALPSDEKKYWHPHTYEVLAGGLIAPEMSAAEEKKFMRQILTTWGKTWHTWPDPQSNIPIGEPLLMWSLSDDGQVDEQIVQERDRQFGVSIGDIRSRRTREIGFEVPHVAFPKSMDQIGRQWTNHGPDQPVPLKR
jgi:uncharacterized protein DUF1264